MSRLSELAGRLSELMPGELYLADGGLLWMLVPAYLAWVALWWLLPRWRRRRAAGDVGAPASTAVRFSTLRHLLPLKPSWTVRLRRAVEGLRLVTVALLLVAMARPQTGRTLTQVTTEGVDIVLAVDASGSMQALDLDAERPISQRRDRLAVARAVIEEFISRRENDQLGLVVFGTEAFTQCPLTLDHAIVSTFLERVEIGVAGERTAIGSALGTAVKRLKESPARSKVVILLTDGRNTAGSLAPLKAAEVAKTFGVKVYAIGVGTREPAPFIEETVFGPRVVYQDVEIDEETLEKIAEITDGAYFRAEDTAGLAAVYERIDELEKTEITMQSYREYDEKYRWFVLPALGLLLAEVGLLGTRLRKLP